MSDTQSHSIKTLAILMFFCMCIMIAEIAGGILSHSLAILTDAAHMMSDILGIGISLFSVCIARTPPNKIMSYGYHRSEVVGALISVIFIWFLTIWLCQEAYFRIWHPQPVQGILMLSTAVFGLIANIAMGVIIMCREKAQDQNLNVKAALIHIIGDTIQSAGVIIAALILTFRPDLSFVDPLCTFMFSFLVTYTTANIVRECMAILMEQSPKDFQYLNDELRKIQFIHDLHIWTLSQGRPILTCHVNTTGLKGDFEEKFKHLNQLCEKKGIEHVSIQPCYDDQENCRNVRFH